MAAAEIEMKILINIDMDTKENEWQVSRKVKGGEDIRVGLFSRNLSTLIDEQSSFLVNLAHQLSHYQMKEVKAEFLSGSPVLSDPDILKKKPH